jgi:NAD(P)-dependent dehydrogenase (short-subunit alcohol dehydrogenase family)
MHSLADKTILLTGASKGIGAAIAQSVGAAGAHLIAHYGGDRAGAEAATADLPQDRVKLIGADLKDADAVEGLWRQGLAWRGRIDVLINNAAVMRIAGGIGDEEAEWNEVWDEAVKVNILAPSRLMRNAVRHYLDVGGGILITISSWAAQRGPGNPDLIAYSATKGAVLAATKTIARNYADRNILAYIIAPGIVRTRMSEQAAAASSGEAALTASLAMKEWVPPAEIGELATFLASGQCRHLTGATLDINGASYIR